MTPAKHGRHSSGKFGSYQSSGRWRNDAAKLRLLSYGQCPEAYQLLPPLVKDQGKESSALAELLTVTESAASLIIPPAQPPLHGEGAEADHGSVRVGLGSSRSQQQGPTQSATARRPFYDRIGYHSVGMAQD